jgi:hypothetical protein
MGIKEQMKTLSAIASRWDVKLAQMHELPEHIISKFEELAGLQRGKPETAMRNAQLLMGGSGVLPFVLEHVGDLIHRMTDSVRYNSAGYSYVRDKVEKTLSTLTTKKPFEKAFNENLKHYAEYKRVDENELRAKVDAALEEYSQAHAALPTYNKVQRLAQDAAVSLGKKDFKLATLSLYALNRILEKGEDYWDEVATEYDNGA